MRRPSSSLISLIAAVDRQGGIGKNNQLLVRLPEDLRHFKRTTLGCPLIMGRKTWDSIGRPLPGRRSIVLTRDPAWHAAGAEPAASLDAALALAGDAPKVFVMGGAEIYAQALPFAHELVLTEIDATFEADIFFPETPGRRLCRNRARDLPQRPGLRLQLRHVPRYARRVKRQ